MLQPVALTDCDCAPEADDGENRCESPDPSVFERKPKEKDHRENRREQIDGVCKLARNLLIIESVRSTRTY